MDSSNADPWEGFTGQSQADADDALIMDPLVRQISELRAALGDSEARRAELEAVVAAVRKLATGPVPTVDEWWPLLRSIAETASAVPSVVLEDRDREVAARALEAVRGGLITDTTLHEWLTGRAAAIRKGDTE